MSEGPPPSSSSSSSSPSRSRLLYRGALAVTDSDLLLDGLTFSTKLDANHNLLENPLALTLETMRGRPTLQLVDVVSTKEIHMDDSGDITLDIHPAAILSRIYFENTFCLPSTSTDTLGIRIVLGDSESTQIIVFLKSIPKLTAKTDLDEPPSSPTHFLSVARITPKPIPKPRLPRPDDPTPRKPPSISGPFGKGTDLRRVASFNASNDLVRKRQKTLNGSVIANLGSDVRLGQKPTAELGAFKVPLAPDKSAAAAKRDKEKDKDKGKGKALNTEDVFGSTDNTRRKVENKGKRKRDSDEGAVDSTTVDDPQQERDNKTRIKQVLVRQLDDRYGVTKTHPEFKSIYNHTLQGVAFALRANIKLYPIEEKIVDRLVGLHIGMYTGSTLFDEGPPIP